MASLGFFSIVMFLVVALTGFCLVSLLVLGGLWLKGRDPGSRFQRDRSTEKPAEWSSTYDDVTGLPTRQLFGTLLEQAVDRAAKTGRSLALLVVELEHFRMVGEGPGQAVVMSSCVFKQLGSKVSCVPQKRSRGWRRINSR